MNVVGIILTSTILSTIITGFWNNYHINRNYEHSQKIQVAKYYREFSGEKMKEILDKWISFIIDVDNVDLEADGEVEKILSQTLKFSSPETSKRLANYQQYIYKNTSGESMEYYINQIILVSGIVASLKHDFTGEWVDVVDIIKIKITDYEDHEDDVNRVINKYGYNTEK